VGPLAALEPKLQTLEMLHSLLNLGLLAVLDHLTLVDHHYLAGSHSSSSSHRECRAVACLDRPLLCLEVTLKTIQVKGCLDSSKQVQCLVDKVIY
jgi:hypothetical protein